MDVPKTSRRLMEEFLSANLKADAGREFADVTVEMEEPLPLVTVSATEHMRADEKPQPTESTKWRPLRFPRTSTPAPTTGSRCRQSAHADSVRVPPGRGSLPHWEFRPQSLLPHRSEFGRLLSGNGPTVSAGCVA